MVNGDGWLSPDSAMALYPAQVFEMKLWLKEVLYLILLWIVAAIGVGAIIATNWHPLIVLIFMTVWIILALLQEVVCTETPKETQREITEYAKN